MYGFIQTKVPLPLPLPLPLHSTPFTIEFFLLISIQPTKSMSKPLLLFLLLSSLASATVTVGAARAGINAGGRKLAGESPFTAKASFIRHWKKHVSGDLPKPWFLRKTSPLDGIQLATFSNLADQNLLPTKLDAFCSEANLLCYYPEVTSQSQSASPSLATKKNDNVHFSQYISTNPNFTNYGTNKVGGFDTFNNYSNEAAVPANNFTSYSTDSNRHGEKFNEYGYDTNIVNQSFTSYGKSATGGAGDFTRYNDGTNIVGVTFTSYSDTGNGRKQNFTTYAGNGDYDYSDYSANTGNDTFISYGINGNNDVNEFVGYGNSSNLVTSSFSNYSQEGNTANDTFTRYGTEGDTPLNLFKSYEVGGISADATFTHYRDNATAGDDAFQSYGKGSSAPNISFASYGQTATLGTSTRFGSYGKQAQNQTVDFTTYGLNTTFKDYAKNGVKFSNYVNGSSVISDITTTEASLDATVKNNSVKKVNRWVESGKFFREKMLKIGTVMPMPDIHDKMPKRAFLPKRIVAKLPFSGGNIEEMQRIFRVKDNSTMGGFIKNAINECQRAPSPGETKHCVGSAEEMVEFATSVLGKNVVVRTTDNTRGSSGDILIGSVRGINGGRVTKSVSCHQSLFPYLLYYCHSVPKVRVYQADILDPKSNEKINQGTAICHVDTSSWSPKHGAFIALGPGPGKIEVCHWIFENDMTWTIAD